VLGFTSHDPLFIHNTSASLIPPWLP